MVRIVLSGGTVLLHLLATSIALTDELIALLRPPGADIPPPAVPRGVENRQEPDQWVGAKHVSKVALPSEVKSVRKTLAVALIEVILVAFLLAPQFTLGIGAASLFR